MVRINKRGSRGSSGSAVNLNINLRISDQKSDPCIQPTLTRLFFVAGLDFCSRSVARSLGIGPNLNINLNTNWPEHQTRELHRP